MKNQKTTIPERLENFRKHLKFEKQKFIEILEYKGLSSYSMILKGKVILPIQKILILKDLEPRLNLNWLLVGEGEMLGHSAAQEGDIKELSKTVAELAQRYVDVAEKYQALLEEKSPPS